MERYDSRWFSLIHPESDKLPADKWRVICTCISWKVKSAEDPLGLTMPPARTKITEVNFITYQNKVYLFSQE